MKQHFAAVVKNLKPLAKHAEKKGVTLCIEPLNRFETDFLNTVDQGLEMIADVGSPALGLLLDTFHMNIEESDIPAALRLAGDKVGHVHFADTNRRAVGMGHLDVAPIAAALREIDYNGYISAEVLPLPDGGSAASQTIESFRKFFPR